MKILAVVPARGGSKRLPGKNIRLLGGKPLIEWTISQALLLDEVSNVMVSTDAPEIAEIALSLGAYVPWLRPSELATDSASSVDVVIHALDYYEEHHGEVDGVMLLQPTSPFRQQSTVISGIELFRDRPDAGVIGVSLADVNPLWCLTLNNNKLSPFFDEKHLNLRSQELPELYIPNGAFYLVSPRTLRATHSFYNDDIQPLVMETLQERIDIDTEMDWKWAEFIFDSIINTEHSNSASY